MKIRTARKVCEVRRFDGAPLRLSTLEKALARYWKWRRLKHPAIADRWQRAGGCLVKHAAKRLFENS